MNFDKTEISTKVMEFLEINLTQEEDKKNFARLLRGKKLLYKEANSFIETLLKALTIEDGKEDTSFVPRTITEKTTNDTIADESFQQSLTGANEIPKQAGEDHPKTSKDNTDPVKTPKDKPEKKSDGAPEKPTCRFYAKGKCRHNKDCRFNHPKICFKFQSFGLKSNHEKGCEKTNCSYFHPNACRDSLKTRTCPREDCRFFHLKGTKNVPNQPYSLSSNQNKTSFETQNRFAPLNDKGHSSQNQVFQKEQPGDVITLKDIMKEIVSIKVRQDLQEKAQKNSSHNSNWRKPNSQRRNTQQQHRAWDSQRRNESQYSQNSQY